MKRGFRINTVYRVSSDVPSRFEIVFLEQKCPFFDIFHLISPLCTFYFTLDLRGDKFIYESFIHPIFHLFFSLFLLFHFYSYYFIYSFFFLLFFIFTIRHSLTHSQGWHSAIGKTVHSSMRLGRTEV